MPNRILRDWTDSETVNAVDVHAERFFTRLIMKVDDYGRQTGNVKLLRPLLYPLLLDEIRESDLQRLIAACVKTGLVRLYEITGKQYIQVENFNQRTRAEKSKFPDPPNDGRLSDNGRASVRQMLTETETETETEIARAAHACPPGADEPTTATPEGVHGKTPKGFAEFWIAWPKHHRKVGKAKCLRHWNRARLEVIAEQVIDALRRCKVSPDWVRGFVPLPMSWLNLTPWETEPDEMVAENATPDDLDPADAAMIEEMHRERIAK